MANPKFSQLPPADPLSGGEIIPVVQGGAAKRASLSDVAGIPAPNKAVTGEIAGVNVQSGTSYVLALSDKGKLVVCSNANAITVTVPTGFKANAVVYIKQGNAGQVSLSPASGVSLETASTLRTRAARSVIALIFHGDDQATVVGDLS
jgi:hypothetical protein